MRAFPVLMALWVAMAPGVRAAGSEFKIAVPEGWKMEVKENLEFHSFHIDKGAGVLMFSKWPPPSKPIEIPELLKGMADGMVKIARDSKDFQLKKEDYEIVPFEGQLFKGSYVIFEITTPGGATDAAVQTMFLMSDGKKIYNGQFTGSRENWEKGLTMLKAAAAAEKAE